MGGCVYVYVDVSLSPWSVYFYVGICPGGISALGDAFALLSFVRYVKAFFLVQCKTEINICFDTSDSPGNAIRPSGHCRGRCLSASKGSSSSYP